MNLLKMYSVLKMGIFQPGMFDYRRVSILIFTSASQLLESKQLTGSGPRTGHGYVVNLPTVIVSPLNRVGGTPSKWPKYPKGFIHGGDPNYLLTGMALQVEPNLPFQSFTNHPKRLTKISVCILHPTNHFCSTRTSPPNKTQARFSQVTG